MKPIAATDKKESITTLNEEVLTSIEILMKEFANIEYQYFSEKNEKIHAASDEPNLEIGQSDNEKLAA